MKHDDPQVPVPPRADPSDDDIVSRKAPLARRYPLWTPLRIPQEKGSVLLAELPLSERCLGALHGNGLLSLANLDGHALVDILRLTACGLACLRELCIAFVDLEILQPNHPDPLRAAIHVPAFAAGYRVDELPLRTLYRGRLLCAGFTQLGDLEGAPPIRLVRAGSVAIREVTALLKTLDAAGPPEPQGLLDALDIGLDGLSDVRRQVLLDRFGAGGEPPMTFTKIAARLGKSGSRVSLLSQDALRRLPRLAGPEFSPGLGELVTAVTQGAELGAELSRVGRNAALHRERRAWDSSLFYERLITALAPALTRPSSPVAAIPAPKPDRARVTRRESSRISTPKATLKDTIDALTESLVESVMTAIRTTPLEALLAEVAPGFAERNAAAKPESPPYHRRVRVAGGARIRSRAAADPKSESAVAIAEQPEPTPHDTADDIADPDLLLSLDLALENPKENSPDVRASIEPSSPPTTEDRTVHVTLRDNETAVQLASGGIVIRRGQVRAPGGARSP